MVGVNEHVRAGTAHYTTAQRDEDDVDVEFGPRSGLGVAAARTSDADSAR